MTHRLVVILPDGSRKTVPLQSDTVTLGRATDNDLSYPDDSGLSRRHVVIEKDGADWLVRDLGSKNGTLVNETRISEAVRLRPGDRITVSRITLTFEEAEPREEPALDGTVIFDPARPTAEKPPTHTVTLDELLPESGGAMEGRLDAPGQWANPVTALMRAGRELVANKPVKSLFRDILDLSMEAVGAGRGVLLALEGEELRVQASRGEQALGHARAAVDQDGRPGVANHLGGAEALGRNHRTTGPEEGHLHVRHASARARPGQAEAGLRAG